MVSGLSSYSSLNGLGLITGGTSGYGYGYGGYGMANEAYTANAKKSIKNTYDVNTYRQSYGNKQDTQNNTSSFRAQTIKSMLESGRTDDAVSVFHDWVNELSGLQQYQGYSELDMKAIALEKYQNAVVDSNGLISDAKKYADSSFMSGLKNSNPISIFLCQSSSTADIEALVTGEPSANSAIAAKVAGAATGGALFAGGAVALNAAGKATKALGKDAAFVSKLGAAGKGILDKVKNAKWSGVKQVAIVGAIIGVACLGAKWLINKVSGATEGKAAQV